MRKIRLILSGIILAFVLSVTGCSTFIQQPNPWEDVMDSLSDMNTEDITDTPNISQDETDLIDDPWIEYDDSSVTVLDENALPVYQGRASEVFNGNVPFFTEAEKKREDVFEHYSDLDSLGRCQAAYANICKELMPTEKRESIGQVKPSGWKTSKYDESLVDGGFLYNRCHLIAFMLAGENANEKNLITGTRYMNVNGMLPYESLVSDYVKATGNHVLYRVTPVFMKEELVARGVIIEAYSIEDEGYALNFCVYCFNVQPGIEIDYQTGENWLEGEEEKEEEEREYVLNTGSKKFHLPTCEAVGKMSEKNRKKVNAVRSSLMRDGYEPCGACRP